MPYSSEMSPVFARFISPLAPFLADAKHQYTCHQVPDSEWIYAGLHRVIADHRSGCAFLQDRALRDDCQLKKAHYFESFKSTRRQTHLTSLAQQFIHHHARIALKANDLFGAERASNKSLADFHIYAGDGHFHAASSHDKRDDSNCKNAIGHLYALNLRNQFLSHLALGSDGTKKKPHDMGVLKKLDIQTLRQGARKGEKVLYIWDRASIDFRQWSQWKNQNAIYFLSRVKGNMKLEHPLPQPFDRKDPINAGILADDLVSNSCGTMIRRVRYRLPETGESIEFLTNLGSNISPGLIAQLYFMRWRIEKSFDVIKNKLYETKAWAASLNAKTMQATFIVLTYNLAQLINEEIEKNHMDGKPQNETNETKKAKRLDLLETKVKASGQAFPRLRKIAYRSSQLSVKFYRWLRKHMHDPASWSVAQRRLATLYATF